MRKIPSTMSTQHPDNASLPPWVKGETIAGEAEVREMYFAYHELGCEEQMWDWEGKDVDPNVVRKLLVNYPGFFEENVIGRDVFLTYRVPNPSVEEHERKLLIEALESIPRCYDVARTFYGQKPDPPVFEVILPLTTSHIELLRVTSCYSKLIVGKGKMRLHEIEDVCVEDWVGEFEPKKIEMIPLIEDKKSLSHIDEILINYIKHSKPSYLRVFLARSDPALNYGLFPAVLLVKLALSKICRVSREHGVSIFPIVGTGSLPFRGHLTPDNIDGFIKEYAGVKTVTVQSALKYDYDKHKAKKTVQRLNKGLAEKKAKVMTGEEENRILNIIDAFSRNYQQKIEKLSGVINFVAGFVPQRRARKLHIGLFGYSRELGAVRLPRAISFAAAMYSLGIPPELIGASALANLSDEDRDLLDEYYVNWRRDLGFASEFLCWQNLNYLMGEREVIRKVTGKFKLGEVIPEIMMDLQALRETTDISLGPRDLDHRKHENLANNVLISLAKNPREMTQYIVEAGRIRHSLG